MNSAVYSITDNIHTPHMDVIYYLWGVYIICGTAHVQVYKQTRVMHHALRNFEDNSCVGLVQHEKYTARE